MSSARPPLDRRAESLPGVRTAAERLRRAARSASKRLVAATTLALLAGAPLALGAPAPAHAQSILGAGGLGFPLEPVDARSRGMGSLGIGLFGTALLPGDPAAAQALTVPVITATYQPSWSSYSFGGPERDVSTSRFPLMGVAYPVGALNGMASLTFASYLDQTWAVEQEGSVEIGGEPVDVVDRFESEGAVSALRLGWAQQVHERLDVAASVGTYLGDVHRTLTRTFDEPGVRPYEASGRWRFYGPTAAVGATWDPADLVRVAGSVSWSGELRADATEDRDAPGRRIDLPTEYRVGVSGSLLPGITGHASASYADWSGASGDPEDPDDDGVDAATSGAVSNIGGGLEWRGPGLLGRRFPLRVGYRRSELPFRFDGEVPVESVITAGIGLNLLEFEELPLAAVDVAFETGSREAGAFDESFRRATVSVRVGGQ